MWKPLFVFCDRKWLNNILIPQAILLSNPNEFIDNNVNNLLTDAKAKVETIRLQHQKYLSEKMKAHEHPLYNTFIYRQSRNRS
jgi:hypothetical protein